MLAKVCLFQIVALCLKEEMASDMLEQLSQLDKISLERSGCEVQMDSKRKILLLFLILFWKSDMSRGQ